MHQTKRNLSVAVKSHLYLISLSVLESIMIYIFELSEECSGGAEDCKLLLHPASFFMFVFHVKNVSLLQGGAGRGGARRALVRTVIPISWSIHHGSSSSPHHCWGLTEPSSAVCGEPVVGRFTVRTPHHHTTTTTTAPPHHY